jgi:hypothetical protein
MIRFGISLFDDEGKRQGILLFNYLGQLLIERIINIYDPKENELFFMLNPDGYILKGPEVKDEWGFMFENRKDRKFGKKFPDVWRKISATLSGQLSTPEGLFTFETCYPFKDNSIPSYGSVGSHSSNISELGNQDYYFTIISFIPQTALDRQKSLAQEKVIKLFIPGLILLFLTSFLFARFRQFRTKAIYEKDRLIQQLKTALDEIKTLQGIIPICSYCKKIRNVEGAWAQVEEYISNHSEAEFTHGVCPTCYEIEMKKIEED